MTEVRTPTLRSDGRYDLPLTRGYVAVFDAADLPLVAGRNWCALVTRRGVYALGSRPRGSIEPRGLLLHRHLLGVTNSKTHVDHKDRNTLNNARDNLRVCTHAQNQGNRPKIVAGSSRFKGVCLNKSGTWTAYIKRDGRSTNIGSFDDEIEAALAYDRAALDVFGEFALTNFAASAAVRASCAAES